MFADQCFLDDRIDCAKMRVTNRRCNRRSWEICHWKWGGAASIAAG